MSALPGVFLSFCAMLLSDFLKLRGKQGWGSAALLLGMLLLMVFLVASVFAGGWFAVAVPLRVFFFLLAGFAGVMVAISLFVSLPVKATYLAGGQVPLQDQGMYALCRHPAALWLPFLLLGAAAGLGSRGLMAAGGAASLLNGFYVWFQDSIVFPRTIPGYRDYRRRVPFLIPTRSSIRNALGKQAAGQE